MEDTAARGHIAGADQAGGRSPAHTSTPSAHAAWTPAEKLLTQAKQTAADDEQSADAGRAESVMHTRISIPSTPSPVRRPAEGLSRAIVHDCA
jgi:hypothetical protein